MNLIIRECMFCGSNDIIVNHRRDCIGDRIIQVCCGTCGGKAPATGSLGSALIAWNGMHLQIKEEKIGSYLKSNAIFNWVLSLKRE